ncbi:uncharacterized protein J3R85_020941 [Psidium guajava]|nr:uncharacterized protein J3R85_020941 [Psidium guajava]
MAMKWSRGAGVWAVLCHSLLAAALVCSKNHGNPANDLVEMINKNRTALKLPALNDSPGIGCMALQYIELCKGNCTNNIPHCKVPEDDFTEIFAPNCGVELPTLGTLTGQIVGCHSKYLEPSLAFSQVLAKDKTSLSLLRNKSHTEVGVGLVGAHKGPFFWCVLFSSDRANSTFVLEDQGVGIKQNKGCFSGSSNPCSGGLKRTAMLTNTLTTALYCLCILLLHL